MANVKISQLPEVNSLTSTDILASVANSITSQITLRNLSNSLTRVTSSISASYAVTASFANNALTASYYGGVVDAFPYVGDARITGSLILSGSYIHGPDNVVSPGINNAFIQGTSNQVSAEYGFVQGQENTVSGLGGHAEGYRSDATAQYFSHAEGNSTTAAGNYSHTEGSSTSTGINAEASHAEGYLTEANAQYSHTEGYGTQTTSTAQGSHAEGYYTIARGNYQHVQGQYNLTSSVQSAFIVGNGTSDLDRRNLIFTSESIMQITGSVLTSGSLISTGSIQTNRSVFADVAHYGYAFEPYNGLYGKVAVNPVNSEVTVSAAISWWPSDQSAVRSNSGPGTIDVVYYGNQNFGQTGLVNQDNFQRWAGSIKFLNNNLTTNINSGKVPYHVLITDNATLTDNEAFISLLDANARRHILGVTGSFLVMGGASIGNNITNQHFITGSVQTTGSLIASGSIQTNRSVFADVAHYANSFQPYNGGYGKLPLAPVNSTVTASAAISWWASDQGASVAEFGPGAIDLVYYCDQNLGQIGLRNQSNFQRWAGSIKFINNNSTTDITNGKVPYHVLITDNATLTDSQASMATLEANNRQHILGVTGSFLARDGVSIGTNITNQHFITGSVLSTGSFTQNGYAILTQVSRSLNFADDAAAATGGVPLGGLYRNGNIIQIRLV